MSSRLGTELLSVGGGTFKMGSDTGDSDAQPVHDVDVSTFRLGKYPIRLVEFQCFVEDAGYRTIAEVEGGSYVWDGDRWNKNPLACWRNPLFEQSPEHPVTCVTWYDAVSFCNWLSLKEGLSQCYSIDSSRADPNNHYPEHDARWIVECDFKANGFRLPTEAEWEFAARGGTKSRGFLYAGANDPETVAWYLDRRAVGGFIVRTQDYGQRLNNGTPMPVGRKQANELGLHDLSGNVREWCWDWYGEGYFRDSPRQDPTGPTSGSFRVNRGGSWQANILSHLETCYRNYGGPGGVFTNLGFRVAATGDGDTVADAWLQPSTASSSRSAASSEAESPEPVSMRRLQARYAAAGTRLSERLAAAVTASGVDTTREAAFIGKRFGVLQKRRGASEYVDVAGHLLNHYSPELAMIVAVELDKQFERRLGYPPIGQIMLSMGEWESDGAARWIGCALRDFPRVEMSRIAFGLIKSAAMRSLVRADLAAEDSELAEYISSGGATSPVSTPPSASPEPLHRTEASDERNLSDGIERMPRRLTGSERRGNTLFRHLQVVSFVALPMFLILGAVQKGWSGAAVGLGAGWVVRTWMRRSMGMRSSNPDNGFFIRMRERANGARRGILEILIERLRQRPFTRDQCVAITQAWEETRRQMAAATTPEEKLALATKLDAEVKRISYGQDRQGSRDIDGP
jgi:formylglycine-generating enzyme